MSDQSQTEGEAPEAAETQAEDPPWLGPIQARMDELSQSNHRMAEQIAGLQRPAESEDDDYDEYGDEDYGDQYETPEQREAISAIGNVSRGVAREIMEAELAKRDAKAALMQRDHAFEALLDEYPKLAEDQALLSEIVTDLRDEISEEFGDEITERIIGSPGFVGMIEREYKSGMYDQGVAVERDQQSEREVVLESASGASQPQAQEEVDWGERILKAAERYRPRI